MADTFRFPLLPLRFHRYVEDFGSPALEISFGVFYSETDFWLHEDHREGPCRSAKVTWALSFLLKLSTESADK